MTADPMALPNFYFQASLPATRESLEPLDSLVRHILNYTGYPDGESGAIAAQIAKAAGNGLAEGKGHVTITFEKDGKRLRISLTAAHLSATAPARGLIDAVTLERGTSGTTYRYELRVPGA